MRPSQTFAEALTKPRRQGRTVRATVFETGGSTVGVQLPDGTRLRRVNVTGVPPAAGTQVDVEVDGARVRVLSAAQGGGGESAAIILMNNGSGGTVAYGAPSPHDLLGAHHTLPELGPSAFLASPIAGGTPLFRAIASQDLPGGFSGLASPGATVGVTAKPGTATTAMRSDGAPALDVAIAPIWTGAHQFNATISSSSIIPRATDTYDLGSELRLWRKGWLSEMDAVLFAQNTITLLGGWFIVGKNEGTFVADVSAAATQIDFGTTMTPGHFVVMRAALKVEYLQVGSLVAGTTYNVTRNLDGSGANDWPAGTPFLVLGTNGDGRIELNAYDTPRISIIRQGATYNAQTEVVRVGDLNGTPGVSTERYGFWAGDASNYFRYDPVGGFIIRAGSGDVAIDASGITMTAGLGAGTRSIDWTDGGVSPVAYIVAGDTGTKHDLMLVANKETNGKTGAITLSAQNPTGFTVLAINDVDYRVYINESLRVNGSGEFGNGLEVAGRGLALGMSVIGTNVGELRTAAGAQFNGSGYMLTYGVSVGRVDVNYDPDPANWTTVGSTLLLNGLNHTSIGFHDSGERVDYIRVGQGRITLGYNAGWGSARVEAPGGISGLLPLSSTDGCYVPATAAGKNVCMAPIDRDGTLTTWTCIVYVDATNNASNYWLIELRRLDTGAVIASINTASQALFTWQRRAQTINAPLTTSMLGVYVNVVRIGSPTGCYVMPITYVI